MLTVAEVCAHLRVSDATVRRLIRTGELRAVKSPASGAVRVPHDALAAYEATWQPVVPAETEPAA